MTEQERSELERLRQRQSQLERELAQLAHQLRQAEPGLPGSAPAAPAAPATDQEPDLDRFPPPEIPPEPVVPPPFLTPPAQPASRKGGRPVPPILPPPSAPETSPAADRPKTIECLCQHCGGRIEFPAVLVGESRPCPLCGRATFLVMEARPPAVPAPPLEVPLPPPPPSPPTAAAERPPAPAPAAPSLEMQVGTYWLVRVGVVMLLTGFVLFAGYAYQNFIGRLGPVGRVVLLYAASGILLGLGAWWQRQAARESLKNYAQVLFAGGLAAVYFTTYAAHHIRLLRLIDSVALDGSLLLAWTGFMVWIADRRKSEVLAWFAVGLAYYASVITRVGSFTLYSNLLLTIAAVFFLVRHRWAALSFASLLATYAAYGYGRFFDGSSWHWASTAEDLGTGAIFLLSYWLLFTAAVFLSKHESLAGQARAGLLTLNNAAFFTMFVLTMFQVHLGGFWKFSLGYGFVLLALALLARQVPAADSVTRGAYLAEGLLFATVGLIARFTGLKLALVLGVESAMLLLLGLRIESLLLQACGGLAGAVAVGWGLAGMERNSPEGLCLGAMLGALMAFNAFWYSRRVAPAKEYPLQPVPAFFTVLALATWLATTWSSTRLSNFPPALAVEALALTLTVWVLRVREFALLGQGYLLLGQGVWLLYFSQTDAAPPWWNPILLLAATAGMSHWWQRQKGPAAGAHGSLWWQGIYAAGLVGILYVWLHPLVSASAWLGLTGVLAIGLAIYGALTRTWLVAAWGQLFLLISGAQFVWQLLLARPFWPYPLAPVVALATLAFGTDWWFRLHPDADERIRSPLLQIAVLYRWTALALSVWWIRDYIPAPEKLWLLALLGLLLFLLAGWYRRREALLASVAYTLPALVLFWLPLLADTPVYWPNLFVMVILLGQRQAAKRLPDHYGVDAGTNAAVILIGGFSLWLFVTRWVCQDAGGFYLTASWSVLALAFFVSGMALRERVYRWLGLGVLALALGRVVIFDVWTLETLYRILSFMALGVVLLVLGFIYNQYQEKIKEWL